MTEIKNHTFVLCAYKESQFLEECVQSLLAQTVKSKILISTSTPNDHIKGIAEKYNLPLYINEGETGITGDWNFAVSCADTKYITIAHQDDVYDPPYAETLLSKMENDKHPIIAFSEYFEIRNGKRVYKNKLLKIKRLMNVPFRMFKKSRFVRRRVLSLGTSICCPAVTFSDEALKDFKFDKQFKFTCDWDAWERLSKKKGSFLYTKKPLMGHRIHEESETTNLTQNGLRSSEEYMMFKRYWITPFAKLIARLYSKGADSNDLSKEK